MSRKFIVALITTIGVAAAVGLSVNRIRYYRRDIKSCFEDIGGLQKGALVRVAGVDVGTVRSVRAHPLNRNCLAEIEMKLTTTYEVEIPRDSIAEIDKEGLLGENYVTIDVSKAIGAPIDDYGYLRSEPIRPIVSPADRARAAELLLRLAEAAKESKEAPKDRPSASSNR